ncbi:MAG: GNAT family N-acetyltransferase [Anaerolineae bacterium]|nr:GNAT family N-acetyltransferase [Gemmatimonadaceae bacterium]
MTSTIRYRPLEWPKDRALLERLDISFDAGEIYEVAAAPLAFALQATAVSPSLFKRYDVAWEELQYANAAIVAEANGSLVGVGAIAYHGWNRRAVISHLYVDRAARGSGIGTKLIAELRNAAEAIGARCLWAETQNVNAAAIRFYENRGFAFCGLDTSLYDPDDIQGETAVFFALRLDCTSGGRPPAPQQGL